MKRAMWLTFAAAFICGLGLIAWGGPWLLAIGVASILCGIAYTGGPWPLGYHGLGDLFVFLFFGLVAVSATYFVQARQFAWDTLLVGIPIGLLAANILVVNNYRDVETDAVAGKRTLAVRFGRGAARAQHAASLAIAFTIPIWMAVRDRALWELLPLIAAPMSWSHMRRLKHSTTPQELIRLLGDTGKLLAFYAILLIAGLVLS
jgi:1,4-dihydroxy-2-naphthoate octaprenyltransferase